VIYRSMLWVGMMPSSRRKRRTHAFVCRGAELFIQDTALVLWVIIIPKQSRRGRIFYVIGLFWGMAAESAVAFFNKLA
jgi:hypothetical protein